MMRLKFGKHVGLLMETLVLKQPEYVVWLVQVGRPTVELAAAQKEARRLLRVFNNRPFEKPCSAVGCHRPATRMSSYQGSIQIFPWCDACKPTSHGASASKLSLVRTYEDAINHAMSCGGRQAAARKIVRSMAQAKGLPPRVGEYEAAEFFMR